MKERKSNKFDIIYMISDLNNVLPIQTAKQITLNMALESFVQSLSQVVNLVNVIVKKVRIWGLVKKNSLLHSEEQFY